MDGMQPGQVIIPHDANDSQQTAPTTPVAPDRPVTQPDENPQVVPSPVPAPEPAVVALPQASQDGIETVDSQQGWYTPPAADETAAQVLPDNIDWTASEFLAHEKNAGWYMLVAVVGLLAAVADYVLTHDKFSTAVILFAVVAFGVISARKPHTQQYSLTHNGLQIGFKTYYFQDFKNFSITEEGAIVSIVFMPLKRFMPPLTIYVVPDMEDQVISFLSELLPFEQHRSDAVDSLLRRIRF